MSFLCVFTCYLVKIILYLTLTFVALLFGLKLWLDPTKRVCKCDTKLNGKVALVTGGNSGIGFETAKDLARRGARVIIASRNDKKSEEAVADIIQTTGNTNVEYRHLDCSDFQSVKTFVDEFNNSVNRLDILVNNAGVASIPRKITDDGIDKIMQVNHLGPFLLTNLLLDKLKQSKPSRIVVVSSDAHKFTFSYFKPDDLAGLVKRGCVFTRYATTKLCNLLWTKALAKRLPEGVTVNAVHPGVVATNIFSKAPITGWFIEKLFRSSKEGAQTTIHLCVAPELENASGGYYFNCEPSATSKDVKNDELVEKVWAESLRLTEGR